MTTPPPVLFVFDGDQVKMHHLTHELANDPNMDDVDLLNYFGYSTNDVQYLVTNKASVEVDCSYIANIV